MEHEKTPTLFKITRLPIVAVRYNHVHCKDLFAKKLLFKKKSKAMSPF